MQDFVITDFTNEVCTDENVQNLSPSILLWAVPKGSNNHMAPTKVSSSTERGFCSCNQPCPSLEVTSCLELSSQATHAVQEKISFQPHPKTLTMAGELEYWAAQVRLRRLTHEWHVLPELRQLQTVKGFLQDLRRINLNALQGRSPLPYALSELIDNALRATQHNTVSRQIVITLALSGGSNPHSGLISVWDNGKRLDRMSVALYSLCVAMSADRILPKSLQLHTRRCWLSKLTLQASETTQLWLTLGCTVFRVRDGEEGAKQLGCDELQHGGQGRPASRAPRWPGRHAEESD